jgi:hypothetical protein
LIHPRIGHAKDQAILAQVPRDQGIVAETDLRCGFGKAGEKKTRHNGDAQHADKGFHAHQEVGNEAMGAHGAVTDRGKRLHAEEKTIEEELEPSFFFKAHHAIGTKECVAAAKNKIDSDVSAHRDQDKSAPAHGENDVIGVVGAPADFRTVNVGGAIAVEGSVLFAHRL